VGIPISINTLIERHEAVTELTYGPGGEVLQVALGVAGMLATDPYLAGESEIVTDENTSACYESSRACLIM